MLLSDASDSSKEVVMSSDCSLRAKGVAYLRIEEKVEEDDDGNDDSENERKNIGVRLKKLWERDDNIKRCNDDRCPECPSL